MQHILNQLILIVGSWNVTGQTDKRLERQFDQKLTELEQATKTEREGALNILLNYIGDEPLVSET